MTERQDREDIEHIRGVLATYDRSLYETSASFKAFVDMLAPVVAQMLKLAALSAAEMKLQIEQAMKLEMVMNPPPGVMVGPVTVEKVIRWWENNRSAGAAAVHGPPARQLLLHGCWVVRAVRHLPERPGQQESRYEIVLRRGATEVWDFEGAADDVIPREPFEVTAGMQG